jgi:predicted HicB family RNase H-like nuclease
MTERTPGIEFPGTGIVIPVPDDQDAEDEAVAAAFEELAASGRWEKETSEPTSADEFYREIGYVPPSKQRRQTDPEADGDPGHLRVRLPADLHRELMQQANRQGVSLNTLIVAYLAREAGAHAALALQQR